jgi:hypothetical protein
MYVHYVAQRFQKIWKKIKIIQQMYNPTGLAWTAAG